MDGHLLHTERDLRRTPRRRPAAEPGGKRADPGEGDGLPRTPAHPPSAPAGWFAGAEPTGPLVLRPDEFRLFIDAKSIRSEHRARRRLPNSAHDATVASQHCAVCRYPAVEAGAMVPWSRIEQRLAGGPFRLPAGLTVPETRAEIAAACEAYPPADRLLEARVYRQSANGSRQALGAAAGEDAEAPAIEVVAADVGHPGAGAPQDGLAAIVFSQLVAQGTDDTEVARALARRLVADRFGSNALAAVSAKDIGLLAQDAARIARDDRAVQDVARFPACNDLRDRSAARTLTTQRFKEAGALELGVPRTADPGSKEPVRLGVPDGGKETDQRRGRYGRSLLRQRDQRVVFYCSEGGLSKTVGEDHGGGA